MSFWDGENRQKKLNNKKPLLSQLNELVPWEEFRPILEQIHDRERSSNAGRKPLDVILIFKLVILQKLFNLSDDQLENQVKDRLSFMKFQNLGIEDPVPDAKTVGLFKEKLTKKKLVEEWFEQLEEYLKSQGYKAEEGQIGDATLILVPRQRNSRKENKEIREGEIPEEWKETPNRLCQKDLDARWLKKNGENHYGYKNHISIDKKYGIIRQYEVIDASVYDSKVLGKLIDIENADPEIWADSAYR